MPPSRMNTTTAETQRTACATHSKYATNNQHQNSGPTIEWATRLTPVEVSSGATPLPFPPASLTTPRFQARPLAAPARAETFLAHPNSKMNTTNAETQRTAELKYENENSADPRAPQGSLPQTNLVPEHLKATTHPRLLTYKEYKEAHRAKQARKALSAKRPTPLGCAPKQAISRPPISSDSPFYEPIRECCFSGYGPVCVTCTFKGVNGHHAVAQAASPAASDRCGAHYTTNKPWILSSEKVPCLSLNLEQSSPRGGPVKGFHDLTVTRRTAHPVVESDVGPEIAPVFDVPAFSSEGRVIVPRTCAGTARYLHDLKFRGVAHTAWDYDLQQPATGASKWVVEAPASPHALPASQAVKPAPKRDASSFRLNPSAPAFVPVSEERDRSPSPLGFWAEPESATQTEWDGDFESDAPPYVEIVPDTKHPEDFGLAPSEPLEFIAPRTLSGIMALGHEMESTAQIRLGWDYDRGEAIGPTFQFSAVVAEPRVPEFREVAHDVFIGPVPSEPAPDHPPEHSEELADDLSPPPVAAPPEPIVVDFSSVEFETAAADLAALNDAQRSVVGAEMLNHAQQIQGAAVSFPDWDSIEEPLALAQALENEYSARHGLAPVQITQDMIREGADPQRLVHTAMNGGPRVAFMLERCASLGVVSTTSLPDEVFIIGIWLGATGETPGAGSDVAASLPPGPNHDAAYVALGFAVGIPVPELRCIPHDVALQLAAYACKYAPRPDRAASITSMLFDPVSRFFNQAKDVAGRGAELASQQYERARSAITELFSGNLLEKFKGLFSTIGNDRMCRLQTATLDLARVLLALTSEGGDVFGPLIDAVIHNVPITLVFSTIKDIVTGIAGWFTADPVPAYQLHQDTEEELRAAFAPLEGERNYLVVGSRWAADDESDLIVYRTDIDTDDSVASSAVGLSFAVMFLARTAAAPDRAAAPGDDDYEGYLPSVFEPIIKLFNRVIGAVSNVDVFSTLKSCTIIASGLTGLQKIAAMARAMFVALLNQFGIHYFDDPMTSLNRAYADVLGSIAGLADSSIKDLTQAHFFLALKRKLEMLQVNMGIHKVQPIISAKHIWALGRIGQLNTQAWTIIAKAGRTEPVNIILLGGGGSGKSTMAENLFDALNRKYSVIPKGAKYTGDHVTKDPETGRPEPNLMFDEAFSGFGDPEWTHKLADLLTSVIGCGTFAADGAFAKGIEETVSTEMVIMTGNERIVDMRKTFGPFIEDGAFMRRCHIIAAPVGRDHIAIIGGAYFDQLIDFAKENRFEIHEDLTDMKILYLRGNENLIPHYHQPGRRLVFALKDFARYCEWQIGRNAATAAELRNKSGDRLSLAEVRDFHAHGISSPRPCPIPLIPKPVGRLGPSDDLAAAYTIALPPGFELLFASASLLASIWNAYVLKQDLYAGDGWRNYFYAAAKWALGLLPRVAVMFTGLVTINTIAHRLGFWSLGAPLLIHTPDSIQNASMEQYRAQIDAINDGEMDVPSGGIWGIASGLSVKRKKMRGRPATPEQRRAVNFDKSTGQTASKEAYQEPTEAHMDRLLDFAKRATAMAVFNYADGATTLVRGLGPYKNNMVFYGHATAENGTPSRTVLSQGGRNIADGALGITHDMDNDIMFVRSPSPMGDAFVQRQLCDVFPRERLVGMRAYVLVTSSLPNIETVVHSGFIGPVSEWGGSYTWGKHLQASITPRFRVNTSTPIKIGDCGSGVWVTMDGAWKLIGYVVSAGGDGTNVGVRPISVEILDGLLRSTGHDIAAGPPVMTAYPDPNGATILEEPIPLDNGFVALGVAPKAPGSPPIKAVRLPSAPFVMEPKDEAPSVLARRYEHKGGKFEFPDPHENFLRRLKAPRRAQGFYGSVVPHLVAEIIKGRPPSTSYTVAQALNGIPHVTNGFATNSSSGRGAGPRLPTYVTRDASGVLVPTQLLLDEIADIDSHVLAHGVMPWWTAPVAMLKAEQQIISKVFGKSELWHLCEDGYMRYAGPETEIAKTRHIFAFTPGALVYQIMHGGDIISAIKRMPWCAIGYNSCDPEQNHQLWTIKHRVDPSDVVLGTDFSGMDYNCTEVTRSAVAELIHAMTNGSDELHRRRFAAAVMATYNGSFFIKLDGDVYFVVQMDDDGRVRGIFVSGTLFTSVLQTFGAKLAMSLVTTALMAKEMHLRPIEPVSVAGPLAVGIHDVLAYPAAAACTVSIFYGDDHLGRYLGRLGKALRAVEENGFKWLEWEYDSLADFLTGFTGYETTNHDKSPEVRCDDHEDTIRFCGRIHFRNGDAPLALEVVHHILSVTTSTVNPELLSCLFCTARIELTHFPSSHPGGWEDVIPKIARLPAFAHCPPVISYRADKFRRYGLKIPAEVAEFSEFAWDIDMFGGAPSYEIVPPAAPDPFWDALSREPDGSWACAEGSLRAVERRVIKIRQGGKLTTQAPDVTSETDGQYMVIVAAPTPSLCYKLPNSEVLLDYRVPISPTQGAGELWSANDIVSRLLSRTLPNAPNCYAVDWHHIEISAVITGAQTSALAIDANIVTQSGNTYTGGSQSDIGASYDLRKKTPLLTTSLAIVDYNQPSKPFRLHGASSDPTLAVPLREVMAAVVVGAGGIRNCINPDAGATLGIYIRFVDFKFVHIIGPDTAYSDGRGAEIGAIMGATMSRAEAAKALYEATAKFDGSEFRACDQALPLTFALGVGIAGGAVVGGLAAGTALAWAAAGAAIGWMLPIPSPGCRWTLLPVVKAGQHDVPPPYSDRAYSDGSTGAEIAAAIMRAAMSGDQTQEQKEKTEDPTAVTVGAQSSGPTTFGGVVSSIFDIAPALLAALLSEPAIQPEIVSDSGPPVCNDVRKNKSNTMHTLVAGAASNAVVVPQNPVRASRSAICSIMQTAYRGTFSVNVPVVFHWDPRGGAFTRVASSAPYKPVMYGDAAMRYSVTSGNAYFCTAMRGIINVILCPSASATFRTAIVLPNMDPPTDADFIAGYPHSDTTITNLNAQPFLFTYSPSMWLKLGRGWDAARTAADPFEASEGAGMYIELLSLDCANPSFDVGYECCQAFDNLVIDGLRPPPAFKLLARPMVMRPDTVSDPLVRKAEPDSWATAGALSAIEPLGLEAETIMSHGLETLSIQHAFDSDDDVRPRMKRDQRVLMTSSFPPYVPTFLNFPFLPNTNSRLLEPEDWWGGAHLGAPVSTTYAKATAMQEVTLTQLFQFRARPGEPSGAGDYSVNSTPCQLIMHNLRVDRNGLYPVAGNTRGFLDLDLANYAQTAQEMSGNFRIRVECENWRVNVYDATTSTRHAVAQQMPMTYEAWAVRCGQPVPHGTENNLSTFRWSAPGASTATLTSCGYAENRYRESQLLTSGISWPSAMYRPFEYVGDGPFSSGVVKFGTPITLESPCSTLGLGRSPEEFFDVGIVLRFTAILSEAVPIIPAEPAPDNGPSISLDVAATIWWGPGDKFSLTGAGRAGGALVHNPATLNPSEERPP